MAENSVKYPIGVQSFEKIRTGGYLYIDKTDYVNELTSTGKYYFLSRPRRFGKSLLLSTIEAYFLGRRDLFEGLAIAQYEYDWQPRPVFHIDLNVQNYANPDDLEERLDATLKPYEDHYGVEDRNYSLPIRFERVIIKAFEVSGQQVVILVDEYDKPMVSNLRNPELLDKFRDLLGAFFGVLKSLDRFIKFGMLTGVSRFGKLSVFSGLNNLNDISIDNQFAGICGITQTELSEYFSDGITRLGANIGRTTTETMGLLKEMYDGYHFSESMLDIYNPFSILNTFYKGDIDQYWFETGTPKFLAEILKDSDYELDHMEGAECSRSDLKASDQFRTNIVPMLFQSGYLTIKGYDREFQLFRLGYPNKEVERGFLDYLVNIYTSRGATSKSDLSQMVRDVRVGRTDEFMTRLKSFFDGFPYDQIPNLEVHYQNVMYIIFKLMGFYVRTEFKTSDGRIDLLIESDRYVYIIECKLKGTAKTALKQINDKDYAASFRASGKTIVKVGVAFDPKKRTIRNWAVEDF